MPRVASAGRATCVLLLAGAAAMMSACVSLQHSAARDDNTAAADADRSHVVSFFQHEAVVLVARDAATGANEDWRSSGVAAAKPDKNGVAHREGEDASSVVENQLQEISPVAAQSAGEVVIMLQVFFAIAYFFAVVKNYPKLPEGFQVPLEVAAFQSKSAVRVVCDRRWENVLLACCCPAPRAAHTMDSTGVVDFWPGCVLMAIAPCCTLWLVHSLTKLKDKLATTRQGCLTDCLCASFCGCCVVAQDAIALDMITGARTRLCGIGEP